MLKDLDILYAEDEDFIRENTAEALKFMGFNVTSVNNGESAYEKYLEIKPDIVIADIEMPQLDGLSLAQKIRDKDKHTQILITTAYTNTEYFLKAVELNLVKYLLKPISLKDLKAVMDKCMANLEYNNENKNIYFSENDYYNMSEKCLMVNSRVVRLDFHEREFLELLLRNHKRVVTYTEFEQEIWEGNMSSAAVRSLVRNLRKKLPDNTVQNVSKIGYRINIQN